MTDEIVAKLGPLAPLAGVWEGIKGEDMAPGGDRGAKTSRFRERMQFEPFGPVDNHEQHLWGLRYNTTAWRLGEDNPFHEEVGYWMWDPDARQVFRCFLVPRGIALIAGGTVEPGARQFALVAEIGSPTYGIVSNPFLDREFRTERYELRVDLEESGVLRYEEDTQLRLKGRPDLFHHTDANTLRRV